MLRTIAGLGRRYLRKTGFELIRTRNANLEREVLASVLRLSEIDLVLDVGANEGQFAQLVWATGYAGALVSFEALPNVHTILLRRAQGSGRKWSVASCAAIGNGTGSVEINVAGNSVSSSILPMKDAHLIAAPESRYVGKQSVPLARLDEIAAPYAVGARQLFLKIDTQGFELEVLKGAGGLLERIGAMQLEVSLLPLYAGAPSLTDLLLHIDSIGFEVFSFVPSYWNVKNGRLYQVDAFLVRKGVD